MTEKTENKNVPQKDEKVANDAAAATDQKDVATKENAQEKPTEEKTEVKGEEGAKATSSEPEKSSEKSSKPEAKEEAKPETKDEKAAAEPAEGGSASGGEASDDFPEPEPKVAKAKPAPKKEPKVPEKEAEPETPYDDFDWDRSEDPSDYTQAEHEKLAEMYEGSFTEIAEFQLITATVVSLTASDAVLDVGFKSDGLVSLSEFRDMPDMKAGDEVEVYVAAKEDEKGHTKTTRWLPET